MQGHGTPTVNRELAAKTAELIRMHPEHHNQNSWSNSNDDVIITSHENLGCGTTMCAAGWASLAAGAHVDTSCDLATLGENVQSIEVMGRLVLGLEEREADKLFYTTTEHNVLIALDHLADYGQINWSTVYSNIHG